MYEEDCCIFCFSDGSVCYGRGYLSSDEGKILQLGMLRIVVNAAIENDIYVIIDWHIEGDYGSTEGAKEFFE